MLAQAALLALCLSSGLVLAEEPGELDCVIEPHVVIDLSSRVDGIVESMEVERGQLIEKGQVLVRLESSVERAAVAEAQVRADATAEILASNVSAEFAQRRNDRIQELHDSQAVSTDQLDEIKTEYELSRLQRARASENQLIARLSLRQAREILNRHTLRSPIRGIVVQHYLAPGEAVEEQPIMRLAQIDPLRVEVIVPVSAFGSIKVGQRAIMKPESPMNGEYAATVTIVDGVADAASGTFRVRLGLPNKDYGLPSGLRCRVKFLPMDEPPPSASIAEVDPQVPETPNPVPPPDEEPTASPAPAQAKPAPYEEVAARTAPSKPGPQICKTIGPLSDAADAKRVMSTLTGQATQLKVREERQGGTRVHSYLLLAPAQGSMKDSRALTEQMEATGFDDYHIFWRGPHKGRISLGVYTNKAFALERQVKLAGLGFESELVPRTTEQPARFWLDVALAPEVQTLDLAAASRMLGKSDLGTSQCEMLANQKPSGQTLAGTHSATLN